MVEILVVAVDLGTATRGGFKMVVWIPNVQFDSLLVGRIQLEIVGSCLQCLDYIERLFGPASEDARRSERLRLLVVVIGRPETLERIPQVQAASGRTQLRRVDEVALGGDADDDTYVPGDVRHRVQLVLAEVQLLNPVGHVRVGR